MEKIRKIAFITKIDEETKEKIIEKVVLFREGLEPLIEDYSRETHMPYVADRVMDEHIEDVKDSVKHLRDVGFIEIANLENKEQMDKLRMEIIEDQVRYNGNANEREKLLETIEQEIISLSNEKKKGSDIDGYDNLKTYLLICRLREYGYMTDKVQEILDSLVNSDDKAIYLVERAYQRYANASDDEKDMAKRFYILFRDSALRSVNSYEERNGLKSTKISFKDNIDEEEEKADELPVEEEKTVVEPPVNFESLSSLPKELAELKMYLQLLHAGENDKLTGLRNIVFQKILASGNERINEIEEAYQKFVKENPDNIESKNHLRNEYVSKRNSALEEVNAALTNNGEKELVITYNIQPTRERVSKEDELEDKLSKRLGNLEEYLVLNRKREYGTISDAEKERMLDLFLSGDEDIRKLELAYNGYTHNEKTREEYEAVRKEMEDKLGVPKFEEPPEEEELPVLVSDEKPVLSLEELLPKADEVAISYKSALQLLKAYSVFDENSIDVEYGDKLLGAISKLITTPHKGEPVGCVSTGYKPSEEELAKAKESLTGLVAKVKDGVDLTKEEKSLLLDDVYILAGIQKGLFKDDEVVSRRGTYTLRDPGFVDARVDERDKSSGDDSVEANLEVNTKDSPVKGTRKEDKHEEKKDENKGTTVKTSKGTFKFRSCLSWLLGTVLAITGIGVLWNLLKKAFNGIRNHSVKDDIEHVQFNSPSSVMVQLDDGEYIPFGIPHITVPAKTNTPAKTNNGPEVKLSTPQAVIDAINATKTNTEPEVTSHTPQAVIDAINATSGTPVEEERTRSPVIRPVVESTQTEEPVRIPVVQPVEERHEESPIIPVVERHEETTVEKAEEEDLTDSEEEYTEMVQNLREQQLEAERMRKELLVSDLANAYVAGDITEQEVHERLKFYGIEEDPEFITKLNEVRRNNAEVERKTNEELSRLNDRTNDNPTGIDPEMDPSGGMSDEMRYEAEFRDAVDNMSGSELLGGKRLVRKI